MHASKFTLRPDDYIIIASKGDIRFSFYPGIGFYGQGIEGIQVGRDTHADNITGTSATVPEHSEKILTIERSAGAMRCVAMIKKDSVCIYDRAVGAHPRREYRGWISQIRPECVVDTFGEHNARVVLKFRIFTDWKIACQEHTQKMNS
ncbi:MAG: hypothetical protein WBE28_08410 [bacterium]